MVLKLVGAAYLIYLGVRLLLTRAASLELAGLRGAAAAAVRRRRAVEPVQSQDRDLLFRVPAAVHRRRYADPTRRLLMLGAVFSVLTFVVKGSGRLLRRRAVGVVARLAAGARRHAPHERRRAGRARGEARLRTPGNGWRCRPGFPAVGDRDHRRPRARRGGQNVNKVSNAVHLRFDVRASSLPEAVKQRLLRRSDHRMTRDGVVIIKGSSTAAWR